MTATKLSRRQISQLGGLARARTAGEEELVEMARKGGATTRERFGREHYIRMAHKRWGRNVEAGKAATE